MDSRLRSKLRSVSKAVSKVALLALAMSISRSPCANPSIIMPACRWASSKREPAPVPAAFMLALASNTTTTSCFSSEVVTQCGSDNPKLNVVAASNNSSRLTFLSSFCRPGPCCWYRSASRHNVMVEMTMRCRRGLRRCNAIMIGSDPSATSAQGLPN